MPNGHQGSQADWARMEAPLLGVDEVIADFARSRNLVLSKNYHGSPERSLTWDDGIRRLIQLYLQDPEKLTFNLWLCASQDRGSSRFWKNDFILKERRIEEFSASLPALLQQGFETLTAWKAPDLEFVTNVKFPPP
jgi:hypothetical protein